MDNSAKINAIDKTSDLFIEAFFSNGLLLEEKMPAPRSVGFALAVGSDNPAFAVEYKIDKRGDFLVLLD